MTKAEERAFEAYPPTTKMFNRHAGRVQSEKVDTHAPIRRVYIKGYHQAEEDLALTNADVYDIWRLYNEVCAEGQIFGFDETSEEVLKRFNERENNQ